MNNNNNFTNNNDINKKDILNEGKNNNFLDIDRMVNEGLGGGIVTKDNGLIEDTTIDTIDNNNDDDLNFNEINADDFNDLAENIDANCDDCEE